MKPNTDSSRAHSSSVFHSAKQLMASVVAHLHSRLRLFSTELAEEKLRLTALLYSVFATLFFFFISLLLGVFFVIAAYWDTPYRLPVIGAIALVFLMGGGISWRRVRTQLSARPRLFEASLAELYQDRQQLESP